MRRPLIWASLAAALSSATSGNAAAQTTLYVDDDAPHGGDGITWETAYRDLQDALAATTDIRDDVLVHLAQGIYRPDRQSGNRDSSFELGTDEGGSTSSAFSLTIRGGFAGIGAPNPDLHSPDEFVSILSGDLLGNDDGTIESRLDNSFNVVTLREGMIGQRYLYDLTIRSGYANGVGTQVHGAGIYIDQPDNYRWLYVTNIQIEDCHAAGRGGGIYNASNGVGIYSTTIRNCTATRGGGVSGAPSSWVRLVNSSLTGCSAEIGGAVYAPRGSTLTISSSTLAGNSAEVGGAVASYDLLVTSIDGCLLVQNSASTGGALWIPQGTLLLRASTLVDNNATQGGAVFLGSDTSATINGSILWGNTDLESEAGIWIGQDASLLAIESCVEGGEPGLAGDTSAVTWARGMIDSDPLLTDRAGPDGNPSTWQDNDYRPLGESPTIDAAPALSNNFIAGLNQPRPFNARGSCSNIPDMGCYEFLEQATPPAAPRIHVDASAPVGGDGRSWQTAFQQIQEALAVPGAVEIWVASGMYFPPRRNFGNSINISCPDRSLRLLGGFAGWENSEDQRDPAANVTIISGDHSLNPHDTDLPDYGDSTPSVVAGMGQILMDGFFLDTGSLTIGNSDFILSNCTISEIDTYSIIYQYNGTLRILNCTFQQNQGVLWLSSGATIEGSLFLDNTASSSTNVLLNLGWDARVDRSAFIGNNGYRLLVSSTDIVISNSSFLGNSMDTYSGILIATDLFTEVVNCAFASNTAERLFYATIPTEPMSVSNSWLWNNILSIDDMENIEFAYCAADVNLMGETNQLISDLALRRLPAPGPDEQWGTPDDDFGDLRPAPYSPLIDTGNSDAVPEDALFDLAGLHRIVDDQQVLDTGPFSPAVDIGPYESQADSCGSDWNNDSLNNIDDIIAYLGDFDDTRLRADLNRDLRWDFYDLQLFLRDFATGCP